MSDFLKTLQNQIIVIDGAMGTMIQDLMLSASAFGGNSFQMLSDILALSKPEALKNIHIEYFKSGANAVETNTFGASAMRLAEFDFSTIDCSDFEGVEGLKALGEYSLFELSEIISEKASKIAKDALEEFKNSAYYQEQPLFVIGSIGPSNSVLSPTNATLKKGVFEEIEKNFYHQTIGLIKGGADVLLFETQQDMLESKASVSGAHQAFRKMGKTLPIMVQLTVDEFSKMQIFNTDLSAAVIALQDIGIDTLGINCSIGPDLMVPSVEKLSKLSKLPISVIPNAGLPVSENGQTVYKVGPDELATFHKRFVSEFGINIVGGCCGTTPNHIKAIAKAVKDLKPKLRIPDTALYLSGLQNAIKFESDKDIFRIGERLNVRGSKKVRDAVELDRSKIDFEALEEVALEQVKDLGLSAIDVCMDSNIVETKKVLPQVIQALNTDFNGVMCIDSFDVNALAEAIKVYPGKPIINSISMEEYSPTQTKLEAVLEATHFFKPAYIALCTTPKGPAVLKQEKYDTAKEMVEECQKYGIEPKNLFIDINAFPIGAEPDENLNFALESLDSIQEIKSIHPDIKTTIGVGNLTNGLAKKPYIRVVLTSVFLDEGKKRGLDAAIVNPNHFVPVSSLDKSDYELGKKVILERDMGAFEKLEEIALAKKGTNVKKRLHYDDLDDITAICEKIKDGFKQREEGKVVTNKMEYQFKDKIVIQASRVIENLHPLTFINDHLMKAMKELGDRFGKGEVSLPHLLKSADVMKQVMGFLEFNMQGAQQSDGSEGIKYKGTIVLGTVYQDVHSIGKDLARTLFENYGYKVIDLGVQVHHDRFIAEAVKHNATAIGMSALLVQTSNHMITIAKMLKAQNLNFPLLVGGAAVNKKHASYIATSTSENIDELKDDVFYCQSAMDGVNTMEALLSDNKETLIKDNRKQLIYNHEKAQKKAAAQAELFKTLPKREIDPASFVEYKVDLGIFEIRPDIKEIELSNKILFSLNWKYGSPNSWEKKGTSLEKLKELKQQWIDDCSKNKWIIPKIRYALLPCYSEGSELIILDPKDTTKTIAKLHFNDVIGAQNKDLFHVAQFYKPKELTTGKLKDFDVVGLQISTAGIESEKQIQAFKDEGDSESAIYLQGLSDRVAEDLAQSSHDALVKLLKINHRGCRYSPGYPAMSDVHLNKVFFNVLSADLLDIALTDANEFKPTSTTAAVVCFHPKASYR